MQFLNIFDSYTGKVLHLDVKMISPSIKYVQYRLRLCSAG